MTKPVCSVVVPSFNCLQYLPIALSSIAIQSVGPVEILILDDGSTDGTWDYLEKVKQNIPELKVVHGNRLGPCEGRNLLISMAASDLIAFLDADDYWWPNKLMWQLAFHEANKDVVMSFTDYLHVDTLNMRHGTAFEYWKPSYIPLGSSQYIRLKNPEAALLSCNIVGTSTVIARKDALQNANGFAKSMPSAEDWDLWLRLCRFGPVAASCAITMSYLMRPGSLTSGKEVRLAAMRQIIDRYEDSTEIALKSAVQQALSRYYVAEAEYHRACKKSGRAAKSHAYAFFKSPSKRVAKAVVADALHAMRISF